jgi:hypothetical protein
MMSLTRDIKDFKKTTRTYRITMKVSKVVLTNSSKSFRPPNKKKRNSKVVWPNFNKSSMPVNKKMNNSDLEIVHAMLPSAIGDVTCISILTLLLNMVNSTTQWLSIISSIMVLRKEDTATLTVKKDC